MKVYAVRYEKKFYSWHDWVGVDPITVVADNEEEALEKVADYIEKKRKHDNAWEWRFNNITVRVFEIDVL